MNIVGYGCLLISGCLLLMGVLGLVRLPDVFCRLQAVIKTGFLALPIAVLGVFFINPLWWRKLLLLIILAVPAIVLNGFFLVRVAYQNELSVEEES